MKIVMIVMMREISIIVKNITRNQSQQEIQSSNVLDFDVNLVSLSHTYCKYLRNSYIAQP